jgi:chemotaxis protein CheX
VIDHELLIKCVTEAAAEVFSTMLDMRIEYTGIVSEFRQSESGLISLVGITGEWGGSGIFCCSPAFANLLHGRMLGEDPEPGDGIDGEVLDVVAEVTNMMVGNIKNSLEAITGPLAISVPTVIHGRNFQFRNASGFRGVALSFQSEGEQFELRIALAPSSDSVGVRSRVPVLGLAHI